MLWVLPSSAQLSAVPSGCCCHAVHLLSRCCKLSCTCRVRLCRKLHTDLTSPGNIPMWWPCSMRRTQEQQAGDTQIRMARMGLTWMPCASWTLSFALCPPLATMVSFLPATHFHMLMALHQASFPLFTTVHAKDSPDHVCPVRIGRRLSYEKVPCTLLAHDTDIMRTVYHMSGSLQMQGRQWHEALHSSAQSTGTYPVVIAMDLERAESTESSHAASAHHQQLQRWA